MYADNVQKYDGHMAQLLVANDDEMSFVSSSLHALDSLFYSAAAVLSTALGHGIDGLQWCAPLNNIS